MAAERALAAVRHRRAAAYALSWLRRAGHCLSWYRAAGAGWARAVVRARVPVLGRPVVPPPERSVRATGQLGHRRVLFRGRPEPGRAGLSTGEPAHWLPARRLAGQCLVAQPARPALCGAGLLFRRRSAKFPEPTFHSEW